MTYLPYLIAKWATGLDNELQPWLLPDDAQQEMFDGYVYRGVLQKREGYSPFATGQEGSAPYCESRMVARITSEVVATGSGIAGPYNLTFSQKPLRRGTITITAGGLTATDNGLGQFTGNVSSPPSGSIDYTNGTATITFSGAVGGAVEITATYDFHPSNPVMGIANFYTTTNIRQLIVFDTQFINRYNSTTNRLDDISQTASISAITNASPSAVTTSAPHQFVSGDKIFISGARGMTQINNTPATPYTITVTGANTFTLNGINSTAYGVYTAPPNAVAHRLFAGDNSNFFTFVNYADSSNTPRLLFCNNVDTIKQYNGTTVSDYAYTLTGVTTLQCLKMTHYKDRLCLYRTTENGTIFPKRIRVSGTGSNVDVFDTTAVGAGVIDIPEESWIFGADYNRDDVIIDSEQSTWIQKYTGNETIPFIIDRIDESRGNQAPFGLFTYLNKTRAASPRGLTVTDGYRVDRSDDQIPDYSFNQIDGDNFKLCYAGAVDEDKDFYLIHPVPNGTFSERILVYNYDELNYTVYRWPMSCMGNFIASFDIDWNDLLIYDTWDDLAQKYGNWNSFAYTKGAPFSVGGGHNGEIWRMAVNNIEDNPQKIRNITYPDPVNTPNLIDIETDFNNYSVGDYIFIDNVAGLTEINNKQFPIISFSVANRTFRIDKQTFTTTAYTSGGVASRVIPFEWLSKKFNPFVNQDKKVRCGWVYFYVDTTGTFLTDDQGDSVNCVLSVDIITNDNGTPIQVSPFNTDPFQVNCSNITLETGVKKWYKMWVNQTAKFIQFRVRNQQAGAKIFIQAMMPGFQPTGRLI